MNAAKLMIYGERHKDSSNSACMTELLGKISEGKNRGEFGNVIYHYVLDSKDRNDRSLNEYYRH